MSSSSTRGRVVGMSRNYQPPRLLTIINPTKNTSTKPERPGPSKKRRAQDREPDVSAPPLSSDEEDHPAGKPERETAARAPKKGLNLGFPSSSDDEDGGPSDRADIRPTTFQSSWNSTKSSSSSRSKVQYGGSQSLRKTYGSARSSQESRPSSSQRSFNSKGPWKEPNLVKGDSLLPDPGRTYVALNKRATATSPRASRPKRPKKATEENARQSTPPKIRLPEDFLHSPRGETGVRSALDISAAGIADSPSPERPPRNLRHLSRSPSVPLMTASLDTKLLGLSDDDSAANSSRRQPSRKADGLPILRGPWETDKGKKTRGPALVEPRPTDTQLDLFFDVDDSSLSELCSDDFEDQKTPDAPRCPYCSKPISADLLRKFSGGDILNFRAQRRLCTAHKEDEARTEWEAKGYPDIDWSSLDARMSSHHDYLERVLRGARCHYGDRLARDVKAGKKRNLARTDFDSSPGYYGARGFRAMQESIFAKFSDLLRERAVEDGLVSARGYSLYVQVVLVPELAVRLVKEDMLVGAEAARGILEESTWVGDLLCEDVGDTVDDNNDDVF